MTFRTIIFPAAVWSLSVVGAAAANARRLLDAFRKREKPVIHIQHVAAQAGATFFLPDTNGAQITQQVAPQADEIVIVKSYPNSFRDTPLLEILKQRNISDVLISGAMSHMCIDATVRAAFDLGFTCMVADDACATKNLTFRDKTIHASDVHAAFMAALSGSYATVRLNKSDH